MDLPPSRYRVVERGRRLEVIDIARGEPVRSTPATPKAVMREPDRGPIAALLPRKLSFDGTAELRTRRFYDANGPRTIRLVPTRAARVNAAILAAVAAVLIFVVAAILWPLLLTGPLLVHFAGIGPMLRKRATKWLDATAADGP